MSKKEKEPKAKKEKAEKPKKRRWRLGDRSDGYKVRTINPMNKMMPYIMPQRCDACNTYADMFDVTKTDKYCREKVKEGRTNFGFLHILIAAYLRANPQVTNKALIATESGISRSTVVKYYDEIRRTMAAK